MEGATVGVCEEAGRTNGGAGAVETGQGGNWIWDRSDDLGKARQSAVVALT